MMGMSVHDVSRLSWWEYQALLWNWNDRHTPPEEQEAEAPDADFVARRMARLEERGLARSLH
jgi:hypothetical protein